MDAKALLESLESAIPGPKIVLALLDGRLQVVVSDQSTGKWDSWFLDEDDHARPPADVAADIAASRAERART